MAAGMSGSPSDDALDGFGATRFSPARAVSAAMFGGSAAVTSGAMRDLLDFSVVSASVGVFASTLPLRVVVAETVESDAVLVASPPSGLGRVPAATAAPTARPSPDAAGVIAASILVVGPLTIPATSPVSATTGAAAGVGPDREAMFEICSISSERLSCVLGLGERTASDVSLTPCEPAKTYICLCSEPLVSVESRESAPAGARPADVFMARKVETSQKPPAMSMTPTKIAAMMSSMLGDMMFNPRRFIHSLDYASTPSGAQCRLRRLTKLRQSRPAPATSACFLGLSAGS